MQDPTVKKLFQEQIDYYSKTQSASKSPLVALFLDWAKNRKAKGKLEVGEFGGAAGQLLKTLSENFPQANLTNIEIVPKYRQTQVLKKIRFVDGSILGSDIPAESFDVLIIKDVLHHLIGRNLDETRKNQAKAIKELKRLLKPNGLVLIDELTNESAVACRILYFLSRANSKIGIRLPKLEISPNTIIFPSTPGELTKLIRKEFRIFQQQVVRRKNGTWRGRLVHLFAPYGKFIAAAHK